MIFLTLRYWPGVFLMGMVLLLPASHADTQPEPEVRIGILAYKGVEAVATDWSHIKDWLNASITDYRFILVGLDLPGLTRAAHEQTIDFVITNSAHYVALEHSHSASRIATIDWQGAPSPAQSTGSVIVVKSNSPLHALTDLLGKHVLAVAPGAFGGYQIAARELLQAGVDPEEDFRKLEFIGFPVQEIVHAVREGRADAGIFRTCLLEQMIRSGEINSGELRVLAPIAIKGFQCQTSSRLYPDWPIAVLPHTTAKLSKQVAIALFSMPRTSEGHSWAVPADYQVVDQLSRELKIGPHAYLRQWTFESVLRRFWGWMLLLLALLVVWAVHTVRVEYLVSQRTRALREAQEEQRRMAEEALLRQAALDHIARLAILGEMASAIAHELNQPLGAIRNFARGIARRVSAGRLETTPLLDGTNEIVTQSERAASIIRNIRTFAQKRAFEQKSVDLLALVGEAIAIFTGTHPQARVVWQPSLEKGAARVMADPLQIQQVMLNLLKNALDAQHAVGLALAPIEVQFRAEAGSWHITVRDCGCGLEPEQFTHLFEPFFTTKPEGLGLGLSLSKGMIESLGGTLSAVNNDENAGLAVSFSLPQDESSGRI